MHNDTKNISVKKGGLYIADLPDDADGSLQSETRPVVIVSNNMANKYSPVVTILPMTSRISKKTCRPTQ